MLIKYYLMTKSISNEQANVLVSKIRKGSIVKINFKNVVDYRFIKMVAELCSDCNNIIVCSCDINGLKDGILFIKNCNELPKNYDFVIIINSCSNIRPDIIINVVHKRIKPLDPFTGGVIPVVTNIRVNG